MACSAGLSFLCVGCFVSTDRVLWVLRIRVSPYGVRFALSLLVLLAHNSQRTKSASRRPFILFSGHMLEKWARDKNGVLGGGVRNFGRPKRGLLA